MITIESHNYDKKKFKVEAKITTNDINNIFITEEMLLQPLYKKIKINKATKAYNFFPYNDVRVECYCKECNTRRIIAFENSRIEERADGLEKSTITSASQGTSENVENTG